MAVVINEFEVETAQETSNAPSQSSAQKEAAKLDLQEIENLLRRRMERAARVWAH